MPTWKKLALSLYYCLSLPYRQKSYRTAVKRGSVPVIILFFHRIADSPTNSLTTGYHDFTRVIAWLKPRFRFISLKEAQQKILAGFNAEKCISITFDDGYADNCLRALPFLAKSGIPYTYFVTLQNILRGVPFAHDLAQGNRFAPNRIEQLRELVSQGVEIGLHGYTHTDLGQVMDEDKLTHEIVTAREKIEEVLDCRVRYFSFPYGQKSSIKPCTLKLARRAGYDAVCSAWGGYNFPRHTHFHLKRIHGGDPMIRIKNWVTVDPRKINS